MFKLPLGERGTAAERGVGIQTVCKCQKMTVMWLLYMFLVFRWVLQKSSDLCSKPSSHFFQVLHSANFYENTDPTHPKSVTKLNRDLIVLVSYSHV